MHARSHGLSTRMTHARTRALTCLYQALAKYLQRSVVSFKLGQVETVEQFQNLMENFDTQSRFLNRSIAYRDVMFVIEEIDADDKQLCWDRQHKKEDAAKRRAEEEAAKQAVADAVAKKREEEAAAARRLGDEQAAREMAEEAAAHRRQAKEDAVTRRRLADEKAKNYEEVCAQSTYRVSLCKRQCCYFKPL